MLYYVVAVLRFSLWKSIYVQNCLRVGRVLLYNARGWQQRFPLPEFYSIILKLPQLIF